MSNPSEKEKDALDDNSKNEIINLIIEQSRYREVVPFIGSGISVSAGFPTISPVIQYLAKVYFAIKFGIYKDRFPPLVYRGRQKIVDRYKQHPSEFIKDFGWPNFGGIDADLWAWLKADNFAITKCHDIEDELYDDFNGINKIEKRDYLLALLQWVLRKEQALHDEGTAKGVLQEWNNWKAWHYGETSEKIQEPRLLYGDWEMLLDKLCEGDFGLTDQLFSELERGLHPAQAHRLLAFLQPKLSIPLVLTTNFDSLLERAFQEEGLIPKIFDIHRNAELPDPFLVDSQLSILKLHGSAYGLRFGERLKQKLEVDARNNILRYIPKTSLILVLGFSGSERRMMQLLQAVVENNSEESGNPELIWIQGPGSPGPLFYELLEKDKQKAPELRKVRACRVKHADTFLHELHFKVASSHQAAVKTYLSLPGQHHMTELKLELNSNLSRKCNLEKKRRPLQFFCAQPSGNRKRSGSWATLAGTAFSQSLHQSYRIIWIDLENHCTVESVISEFFARVNVLDPKAPNFNFSLLGRADDTSKKLAMQKAVNRICEVFSRGKYALVLDSVESFGRPPMVHHGVPTYKNQVDNTVGNLLCEFKEQIYLLKILFDKLFEKESDEFKDSYIITTIDIPRKRHNNQIENIAFDHISKFLNEIIDSINKKSEYQCCIRFLGQGTQNYSNLHEWLPKNPGNELGNNWKDKKDDDTNTYETRSLERAIHVYFLLKLLRVEPCEKFNSEDEKGIISAFICLLSVFRRPRSIPLLRAMIDRWVLRNIQNIPITEEQADKTHDVIEYLLVSLTQNCNFSNSNRKNNDKKKPKNGDQLLTIIDSQKNNIGAVAQSHEGGSIWMFREPHEESYESLTESLHVQASFARFKEIGEMPKMDSILDGMVCVSWHLYAARTYYVDLFLPTRDIQAFYEYIYHRVSALKTIAYLIATINLYMAKEETGEEGDEKNINAQREFVQEYLCKNLENRKLSPKCQISGRSIIWYADVIGVFSEDPEYITEDGLKQNREGELEFLLKQLKSLRKNALKTLFMGLSRNKSVFRAYANPEIVFSWARQFIYRELEAIQENYFSDNEGNILRSKKDESDNEFEDDVKKLRAFFLDVESTARLSKMDFEGFLESEFYLHRQNSWIPGNQDFSINALIISYENLLSNSKDFEEQGCNAIQLLRCLIYQNPEIAERFSDNLLRRIKGLQSPLSQNAEKLIRDAHALKARSILSKWSIWKPLRNRKPVEESINAITVLPKAEKSAIDFEDSLRITCSSKEEEARHRSSAFVIRARTLYLRPHYRQAHRFLDLAGSGLELNRPDHRTNAGVLRILRAELLGTSADWHYRRLINDDEQKPSKEKLLEEINASLKKIKRAEQELNIAEELLRSMLHQRIWLVYLEFGCAQLKLEKMLFEMELLYFRWNEIKNESAFLKHSGELEQNVLDCMGRLRSVFDLIPYRTKCWGLEKNDEKSNIVKYSGNDSCEDDYPALIKIERMCYGLWNDLFIVGAFFHSILHKLYHTPRESVISNDNRSHYLKRWKQWCLSMRFNNMSTIGDVNYYFKIINFLADMEVAEIQDGWFRENIISIMQKESSSERVDEIWNIRRGKFIKDEKR